MTRTYTFESSSPRHRRCRRLFLKAVARSTAAFLLLGVAGWFLYGDPITNPLERTDVLVVLAPQGDRTQYAEQLMDQGYAATLAISAPNETDVGPTLCGEERTYRIVCFQPDPVTTQGEARAVQRLAKEHEWETVSVLTAQFHVTRARLLMQRCYEGDLAMIAYRQEMPLLDITNPGRSSWLYHFAYESAAFVKVGLNQGC